jgi:hypothetical protein
MNIVPPALKDFQRMSLLFDKCIHKKPTFPIFFHGVAEKWTWFTRHNTAYFLMYGSQKTLPTAYANYVEYKVQMNHLTPRQQGCPGAASERQEFWKSVYMCQPQEMHYKGITRSFAWPIKRLLKRRYSYFVLNQCTLKLLQVAFKNDGWNVLLRVNWQ